MGHLERREKASFQKIAEAFTAKHPKVTVKYVNVPYGDAQNKVKNAFSSGSEAPDVIRADVGWVADFASLGYLDEVPADTAKKVDAEFLPQAPPAASTRARPTPSRRSSTPSASSTTRRCSPTPASSPPRPWRS